MVAAIQRTAGGTAKRFPWWIVPLLAPFVTFLRELLEMRYLWRTPLRMTSAKLVAELGSEPHTPIDDAVRTTLQAMGCLAGESRPAMMTAWTHGRENRS